jgi:hypothetical protein
MFVVNTGTNILNLVVGILGLSVALLPLEKMAGKARGIGHGHPV